LEGQFTESVIGRARKALIKGDTAEAEKLFEETLNRGIKQAALAAMSAVQLGRIAYQRIEYEKAYSYFRKAVELESDNPHYLHVAGIMAYTLGRYAEAEPLFKRSLEISEKSLGPDHPDVAGNLNNLGELFRHQGRDAEAEPLYKRAIAIVEKTFGSTHPELVGMYGNYALLLRKFGRETEAVEYERKAEQVKENLEKTNKGANELNPLGAPSTALRAGSAHSPLLRGRKGRERIEEGARRGASVITPLTLPSPRKRGEGEARHPYHGTKDVPPPKASSPSSLKIPSGADDPGFKLRYHHIALTKSRGVKEMNGTRIEALHETNIPASLWPSATAPPGGSPLQKKARGYSPRLFRLLRLTPLWRNGNFL
jgi:Tfp pilus assembly protein PilF